MTKTAPIADRQLCTKLLESILPSFNEPNGTSIVARFRFGGCRCGRRRLVRATRPRGRSDRLSVGDIREPVRPTVSVVSSRRRSIYNDRGCVSEDREWIVSFATTSQSARGREHELAAHSRSIAATPLHAGRRSSGHLESNVRDHAIVDRRCLVAALSSFGRRPLDKRGVAATFCVSGRASVNVSTSSDLGGKTTHRW